MHRAQPFGDGVTLKPGERLTQEDIAARLNVSRQPVTHALAVLKAQGAIVNITDMKPLTTDPHPSAKPAKYALEMNQGWFAKRGIKAGARIDGLKEAPAAQ